MSFLQIPIGTYPNTFLGYESSISMITGVATGIRNSAFGNKTLRLNTTGVDNSAFGNEALSINSTGNWNSAFGNYALRVNQTGVSNSAFGDRALTGNLGSYNSSFGSDSAGSLSFTGSDNCSFGYRSLWRLETGSKNSIFGVEALSFAFGAESENSAFGWRSLYSLNGGNRNSAFGYQSGSAITTGSKNSILGSYSGNQGGLDIRTLSNYIVLSDGDGNPRLWINDTGAVNIPGGLALTGSLSITGGTVTANNPVLSATQTWNNAAVTFTGWQLNVTDTASNAASLLMDLQVGGASQLSVDKSGVTKVGNAAGGGGLRITNSGGAQPYLSRNSGDGGMVLSFFPTGSGCPLWIGGALGTGAMIVNEGASVLAQRAGVNAQTLRVYNTFTDASNYERAVVSWASNILTVGSDNAGTGLARDFVLQAGNRLYLKAGGVTSWEVNAANGHILAVADNSYDIGAATTNRPRNVFWAGYQQMSEMTAPAAPAANSVRIYAEDNGSGKTRLMALFATGAAQQIAIEP